MKKFLIITNVFTAFILASVLYTSCNKGVIEGDIATTCYACDPSETTPPVSAKYIYELISRYRKRHYSDLMRTGNPNGFNLIDKPDSRSVWFSLNKLKNFIRDIEVKAAASLDSTNCAKSHCELNLGVRVYFGEYGGPNTSVPGFNDLHTLVMVPTYQDKTASGVNTHVDFDPNNSAVCSGRTIPLDTSLNSLALALTPDIAGMNNGNLIPPPDPVYGICTGARWMHLVDVKDLYRPATGSICY